MDILVVGHLSRDLLITPEITRESLGGGAAYAMLAPAVGAIDAGIVSKVGFDFEDEYLHILKKAGLDVRCVTFEGPHSTRFINEYDITGQRSQRVEHLAPPILIGDIQCVSAEPKIVHYCPLSKSEIDISIIASFCRESLISLDAQGFLRDIKNNEVQSVKWREMSSTLKHVDVVKFDATEIEAAVPNSPEYDAIDSILETGPRIVIITRDRDGTSIFTKEGETKVPIVLARKVVDTTGSGDTFTIGFLLEYLRTKHLRRSGLFAASCASFNLENIGPYVMPTRKQVFARMADYL